MAGRRQHDICEQGKAGTIKEQSTPANAETTPQEKAQSTYSRRRRTRVRKHRCTPKKKGKEGVNGEDSNQFPSTSMPRLASSRKMGGLEIAGIVLPEEKELRQKCDS